MKFYELSKDKDSEPIEITESRARKNLNGYYRDIDLAIQTLRDGQKLQTDFAIYWANNL